MDHETLRRVVRCALVLGLSLSAAGPARAVDPQSQEPPLRLEEPLEAIVADLEDYIPRFMRDENIPGLAIALVHDGQVAWTEGFGVANSVTGRPVTADTLFEFASNSKVVAAYTALRLVDEGLLALDDSLNGYLADPWLPPSEHRDDITLRHVLSHSAGLGRFSVSRDSLFPPGRGYSYSPAGYSYLQAVIENVTGAPLEAVAQEKVLAPLGMQSSSFVGSPDTAARTANGHVRAVIPALIFGVLHVVSFAAVGLVGVLPVRARTGRWRPTRSHVIGAAGLALALALAAAFEVLGRAGFPGLAWLVALCGFVALIALLSINVVDRVVIRRLLVGRRKPQAAASLALVALVAVGLFVLAARATNVPVPRSTTLPADAAGSMRATVGDMALFLIELSSPRLLSPSVVREMRTPQVSLSEDLSWGLGPGILHGRQGDALWQWGQQLHFQSVMIVYPDHGFGVVVCTNTDLLDPEVAIDVAHRALGGEIEPIRRASRLTYNYREG